MYLNYYSPVQRKSVLEMSNGDVMVVIGLENGAAFSMTLSDIGSKRLGVRDYIELRSGNVTIRICDGRHYESENHRRIIRRKTVSRMDTYRRMYKKISKQIVEGKQGDSLESLRSSELAITLEEELQRARRVRNAEITTDLDQRR